MTDDKPKSNNQTLILLGVVVVGLTVGAALFSVYGPSNTESPDSTPPAKPLAKTLPESVPEAKPPIPAVKPPVAASKKPAAPAPKPVAKAPPKKPRPDGFIIEGDLATDGKIRLGKNIIVKILWIRNENGIVKLGLENADLIDSPAGMRYQFRLKQQPKQYTSWHKGVEGNFGRVLAYLDEDKNGEFTIADDRILAVSKELVLYRTGRFDNKILNKAQQENVRKKGKGYLVARQVQQDNQKADWEVAYRASPAFINLSASDTNLAKFYTTMIKLQNKQK